MSARLKERSISRVCATTMWTEIHLSMILAEMSATYGRAALKVMHKIHAMKWKRNGVKSSSLVNLLVSTLPLVLQKLLQIQSTTFAPGNIFFHMDWTSARKHVNRMSAASWKITSAQMSLLRGVIE